MSRPREISDFQEEQIKRFFVETLMTYEQIAAIVSVSSKQVHTCIHRNFSQEEIKTRKSGTYRNSRIGKNNPSYGKRGSEGFNWKGGKPVTDGKGYLIVPKPDWYTGRKGSKYVFQHTVVMCEALGITELPAGFVVHHLDGDKTNNNLNNLALVTMAGHTRLHALERVETIPQGSRGK